MSRGDAAGESLEELPIVRAQVSGDVGQAVAWQRIAADSPRFAQYQQKTDRELPVIRLTAR